jgi:tRNA/rRNA methyltransferase
LARKSNLVVVLVEPENPGNVGFVARVLANFGASDLRLVGTDFRKESQAQIFSVHAAPILETASVYETLEEALSDLEATWAATARAGKNHSVTRALVPLEELPDPCSRKGRVGLVFGRESSGLTNEEVSLCDLAFSIPTFPEYPSMNLSHAVAVVLFHLCSTYLVTDEKESAEARAATRAERERACMHFDRIVDHLEKREHKNPIVKQVFRNLLGRSYMTGREVTTLIGIVKKIDKLLDERSKD